MGGEAGELLEDIVDTAGDIIEGGVEIVGDVLGGAADVVEGVVEGISDVGSWIDDNVLQPMLDDPIKTIATITAISTGNGHLVPYINAADTVAKGGDLEDVGKSFATSYVSGQVGGQVGGTVAQETGSAFAGEVAKGAARGATSAAISGGDVGTGALVGGVTSGVSAGVKEFTSPRGTTLEVGGGEGQEVLGGGITPGTGAPGLVPSKTEFGITPPQQPAIDFSKPIDYGLVASGITATPTPVPTATPPKEGEEEKYELVKDTTTGTPDFGIDSEQIKLLPDKLNDPTFNWSGVGKYVMGQAASALGNELLNQLLGGRQPTARTTGTTVGTSEGGASEAESQVELPIVAQAKYEMRKYENQQGQSVLIPFKDDEPQMPIPAGYSEAREETLTAAKGGLAAKKKKEKKPITGKGLAVKKK